MAAINIKDYLECVSPALFPFMGREEQKNEAWATYIEARMTYGKFRGCCAWDEYLDHRLLERADCLQKAASRKMLVESPASLDAPNSAESDARRVDFICGDNGDFLDKISFEDFLGDLESKSPDAGVLARGLANGDTFNEVSADHNWDAQRMDRALTAVRRAMREYRMQ